MSRRTIQSPGVEIREIDLTQRPAAPVGTGVFVAGFSNQGPTDEVFNVGTFAEFEEIYGKPTNAAERYFYHSTRQVFNSDANVFVSRLPYGSSTGDRKYSALVYPVASPTTATITAVDTTNGSWIDLSTTAGTEITVTDTLSTDTINIELVMKDSNDTLSFVNTSMTGLSGMLASSPDSTAVFRLSAANTGAMGKDLTTTGVSSYSDANFAASIIGKTLVTGQVQSNDVGALDDSNSSLSAADYYVIGSPTLVELTEAQFNSASKGNITWSNDGNIGGSPEGAPFTGDFTSTAGAGIIVLNKGATITNNNFEGYYVGTADGSNSNPATNFDTVNAVYTTTSTATEISGTGYATVPGSRIGFNLTSLATEEKSSTSKTLETFSKFDIDGPEFLDTISLGVFKIRNTPFANSELELTNFLAEGYTGSLNSRRKVQNENGGQQRSFFLEDQDNASPNIKILINPNISEYSGDWTSTVGDVPTKTVRVAHASNSNAAILNSVVGSGGPLDGTDSPNYEVIQGLFPLGVYHTTNNTTKFVGSIPDKLDRIFEIAQNVDVFTIDVSIEAGLGTIHAFAANNSESFIDTDFQDVGGTSTGFFTPDQNMIGSTYITQRDNYRTIFNRFETFARQTRKDHIFIADALRPLVVQGEAGKVLDDKTKNFSKHVYWPLRHQFGIANSNFATTYGNWAKVWDGTSGKQIWIPFSGVAAKIYANNDSNFAPWYAPAGFNRGVVTGVNDIAVSPTQRQRDQLYRIAINPVTQFPAEGIIVFGQKTLQRKPTAFDRVNVRRLFLDLEKRTRQTLKFFVFEPNTFLTRTKVVNTLTPIFENCKQTEGVYDYLIVCDERNNPPSVIDQNELRVDIYLKPVRAAEFILVNFYAVNTEVNFEEIVGQ